MAVKPILFSGPMVRAILEGRKTQTRRVLKLPAEPKAYLGMNGAGDHVFTATDTWGGQWRSPFSAGDLLWVREAWATVNSGDGPGWAYRANGEFIQPDYDGENFGAGPSFNYDKYPGEYCMWFGDLLAGAQDHGWKSPIHMPRWASRLTLRVTDVRVQRVQEISEADALAEGVERLHCRSARDGFRTLWDGFNDKRGHGWDVNRWVAAYTFETIRENVDKVEAA